MRAIRADAPTPRAVAGRIRCSSPPFPEAGRICKRSEKTRIRIRPIQKTGIELPSIAKTIAKRSTRLFCFTADSTPRGRPITMAIAMAASVSCTMLGNRAISSSKTGVRLR